MSRTLSLLFLALWTALGASAQNVIVQQGFEGTGGCPDWSYAGGVVNTELARTGARSARVGRNSESNTVTFSPVTVTGYVNVQLSIYHAASAGSGPGMDTEEGATMQVRLNGGAWTTVGAVGGFSNCSWIWSSPTGGCGGLCGTTCPNPMVFNVPNGTTTVEVRAHSTACPSGAIANYDRPDEGFFIDDVKLTTTSTVVTPSTGSVTWNGTQSTDWFDCRNWTPTTVPGPGWNVTIDQTTTNACIVGNSATTPLTAFCSTLTLSSTGPSRRLLIGNGRSLEVGGAALVQRSGATADSVVLGLNNGSFTCGSLTVGGPNARFRNNGMANTAQVEGDLLLSPNGTINITNGSLGVGGDLRNNASAAAFIRTGSTVLLNGIIPQIVYANAFTDLYASLSLYKEAGDVTLATPITVTNVLDLFSGRLFTDATNLLTLRNAASVVNASDNSFVHGPVRKEGSSAFLFPTGKNEVCRPIGIAGNTVGTTSFGTNLPTNHFTAEYKIGSPRSTPFSDSHDGSLDHISDCEYWTLDRTGGTLMPFVGLSWAAPASCGVTALSDLRVARWTGSLWNDRGNGGASGTTTSGIVPTLATQSAFGNWTLASSSAANPLPIQLLSFTAEPEVAHVRLDWTTLTEQDNAYFTVERAPEDGSFSPVLQMPGAGNSIAELHYQALDDAPLQGLSYYRLRQTDLDGATTLSAVVPVLFSGSRTDVLGLTLADDRLVVQHGLPAGAYAVLDMEGRAVRSGTAAEGRFELPIGDLAAGIYLLRVNAGERVAATRFMH